LPLNDARDALQKWGEELEGILAKPTIAEPCLPLDRGVASERY
jgi:hypothetical protein